MFWCPMPEHTSHLMRTCFEVALRPPSSFESFLASTHIIQNISSGLAWPAHSPSHIGSVEMPNRLLLARIKNIAKRTRLKFWYINM